MIANNIATFSKQDPARSAVRKDYLTEGGHTLGSWLLTTDHKRIGILYLHSILFYFLIAALAAALIRMELITPQGDMVTSETYNKLFTVHGVLMVWFFLIPSIPAVLGNFVIPMMIGARDVAFPKLNLLSWYLFNTGGAVCDSGWRRGYRLDLLHPIQQRVFQLARDYHGGRHLCRRLRDHSDRPELHRHDPSNAGAGNDLDAAAALSLVALFDQRDHGPGHARAGDDAGAHGARENLGPRTV